MITLSKWETTAPDWHTDKVPHDAAARRDARVRSLRLPWYPMLNLFMAGPDLVRSELTALGANGPYRLIIRHGQGSIVEYFLSSTAALLREAELERLLMCARGANPAQKGVAA